MVAEFEIEHASMVTLYIASVEDAYTVMIWQYVTSRTHVDWSKLYV